MNPQQSEDLLVVIFLLLMPGIGFFAARLASGLKRLLLKPIRRRQAKRCARRIAARTNFDTALAKLAKENGR